MGIPQYKDISLWQEDDILALPTGEHDWLEFKASAWFDPKKEDRFVDASKYFSAWANYDGGYFVIGVKNPKVGDSIEIDGGVPVIAKGNQDAKEWLENKLPSLIDPTLEKFAVQLVLPKSPASAIKPEHCVVVIHVPPSSAAPHQARDNKYYTRVASHLAPLGSRAVLDIAGRRKNPDVRIKVLTIKVNVEGNAIVSWELENCGGIAARNFCFNLLIPLRIAGGTITLSIIGGNTGNHPAKIITGDGQPSYYRFSQSNTVDRPLFPSGSVEGTFVFRVTQGNARGAIKASEIKYFIYADNAPVNRGSMRLTDVLESLFSPPPHW